MAKAKKKVVEDGAWDDSTDPSAAKGAPVIEYRSNNSGGSWWLQDKDWKALEDVGWEVEWGGLYFCRSKFKSLGPARPKYLAAECDDEHGCPGHRAFESYEDAKAAGKKARWLNALAKEAHRYGLTLGAAIKEFERVTSQNASALGCNCCGSPHSFYDKTNNKYYYPVTPAYGDEYDGE